jgi:DNA-directed RNA polymerase specialized sigma24 family protein
VPSLAIFSGAADPELAGVADRLALRLLAGLPRRERAIVVMSFFGGMTQG